MKPLPKVMSLAALSAATALGPQAAAQTPPATAQTQEQTSAGKEVLRTRSSQIEFASQRNKRQPRMAAAILRQRSSEQELSSHAALLDVAHAFTPRVEDTHPDRLLLDLDGMERLTAPFPQWPANWHCA